MLKADLIGSLENAIKVATIHTEKSTPYDLFDLQINSKHIRTYVRQTKSFEKEDIRRYSKTEIEYGQIAMFGNVCTGAKRSISFPNKINSVNVVTPTIKTENRTTEDNLH
ncbi:MAG: hypothetical protein ACLR5G_12670 [Eubacteriales bacterium]